MLRTIVLGIALAAFGFATAQVAAADPSANEPLDCSVYEIGARDVRDPSLYLQLWRDGVPILDPCWDDERAPTELCRNASHASGAPKPSQERFWVVPRKGDLRIDFNRTAMRCLWGPQTQAQLSIFAEVTDTKGKTRKVEVPGYATIENGLTIMQLDVASGTQVLDLLYQASRFAHRLVGKDDAVCQTNALPADFAKGVDLQKSAIRSWLTSLKEGSKKPFFGTVSGLAGRAPNVILDVARGVEDSLDRLELVTDDSKKDDLNGLIFTQACNLIEIEKDIYHRYQATPRQAAIESREQFQRGAPGRLEELELPSDLLRELDECGGPTCESKVQARLDRTAETLHAALLVDAIDASILPIPSVQLDLGGLGLNRGDVLTLHVSLASSGQKIPHSQHAYAFEVQPRNWRAPAPVQVRDALSFVQPK